MSLIRPSVVRPQVLAARHPRESGDAGGAVAPFADAFDRAGGAPGDGWLGDSWAIAGGAVANSPALGAEMFANPGAEGTYVDGVAPDWAKSGSDGTWSEETTLVHGGSSAQKFAGGATAGAGAMPAVVDVTEGSWYLFDAWVRNEGPGAVSVRRHNGRLANVMLSVAASGAYQRCYVMDRAASTGIESVKAVQAGTTPQTFTCDDFSLRPLAYPSLFLARRYRSADPIAGAAVTYAGHGLAGIVASLDDPADPQNYVLACYDGTSLKLSKFLDQAETNLITQAVAGIDGGWVDGELLEVRKNGDVYQMWYRGAQVGTDQTISDAALVGNQYVGLFASSGSTFDAFHVRSYGSEYERPDLSAFAAGSYPEGNGVLSLRFDDNNARASSYVGPALDARGLVGGFALVRSLLDRTGQVTLAGALALQAAGHEILCHSLTHGSDPATFDDFVQESSAAAGEMRRLGLEVWSWVQPGSWVAAYNLDTPGDYGSPADAHLRRHFQAYEAYVVAPDLAPRYYSLPRAGVYGVQHVTGDALGLAALQGYVDDLVAYGAGMEILFHPLHIAEAGYISEADFEAFLDYVQAAVGGGTLTVLPPTAQLFAAPGGA